MSRRVTKRRKQSRGPTPPRPKGQVESDVARFKKRLHDLVNQCEAIKHGEGPTTRYMVVVPEALYQIVSENYTQRLRFETEINANQINAIKVSREERKAVNEGQASETGQGDHTEGNEAA